MFTWICPKCGGEVPPSYSECPKCSPKTAAAPPAAEPHVQSPPPSAAPPETPAPQPVVAPPVWHPPAPVVQRTRRSVSPTLVAICAAAGLVVLLGILYMYVLPDRSQATGTPPAPLENPGVAGSAQSAHPLAKHLELAGIRITEAAGQSARVNFVVINHSGADLPELKMEVSLRPSAGGNPVFDFPVDLPSIGPYESREMTRTVKTTLKPYEIPDWQMLRPEFRLASE